MPTPSPPFRVTLPGAEDVATLIPDAALSPDARAARRAQRSRRLQESPTPEIVRNVQHILTAIDNVQDALVTLSLLTRLAVPRVRALAPFAKAVATAADITNLGRVMQNLGLVGGTAKGSLYRHLSTQPQTYSSRLRSTLRTSRVNPTVGEALQVLQTTRDLFGVGLQVGPIMGLPIELLSLVTRGGTLDLPVDTLIDWATIAPLFLSASPWLRVAGIAAGFALSALPKLSGQTLSIPVPALIPTVPEPAAATLEAPAAIPTLTALEQAEQVLSDAAYLDATTQELSVQDHAMIDVARFMALALLAPIASCAPGGILVPEKTTIVTRTPPVTPRPLAWVEEHPTSPEAIAVAALTGQAMGALAIALEGPGMLEPRTWSKHALAVARAVELGHAVPQPPST